MYDKLGDRRSMMDAQIENNFTKVGKINQTVQGIMSKTRAVAEGKVNAAEALLESFDRLVNRAFALAQANDVPAREMKAARRPGRRHRGVRAGQGAIREDETQDGRREQSAHG